MPTFDARRKAAELQHELAKLTGHERAGVRPYGKHLLIQMNRDDTIDTVARLTQIGRHSYEAAFRSHTGRWEPLPGTGNLIEVTAMVVALLAPYLNPNT
jgi:hypothetical protein